jgi:hypothetical protein
MITAVRIVASGTALLERGLVGNGLAVQLGLVGVSQTAFTRQVLETEPFPHAGWRRCGLRPRRDAPGILDLLGLFCVAATHNYEPWP